ncbi:hypothetical protein [Aestuariivirga sp.]|uniref:hypothetical protein n=1 Tax=Aestuariivirga sp. TaxID=2650926 RepID=UPI00301954DC
MKRLILASFLASATVVGTIAAVATVTAGHALAAGPLGDLSSLQAIVTDVESIAQAGDFAKAQTRITDFETLWDKDEEMMKPINKKAWHHVDDAADAALKALRTKKPEASEVSNTLSALAAALDSP